MDEAKRQDGEAFEVGGKMQTEKVSEMDGEADKMGSSLRWAERYNVKV